MNLSVKNTCAAIRLHLPKLLIGVIFIYLLESCQCKTKYICVSPGRYGEIADAAQPEGEWQVISFCSFEMFNLLYALKYGQAVPVEGLKQLDSAAVKDDKKLKLVKIPATGEDLATTVTLGSTLNFKSSNEDYGEGYGKHQPGVGFNIGVGTVLPVNKNWALAPSVRFTQKNASEKLGYSEPGGAGGLQYTDKYSYNYVGAALLGQYRAGKNVSLVAGPELNFLMSSSVKNGGSSGSGNKQSLNKTSQKAGMDVLAGIKYEIPAKNNRSKWGVQLMYDHRLSRLNKKKDEAGMEVPAYRMKGVQLSLAYHFCNCK
jgi:Outer membrane protein beta-barrel domain